MLYNVGGRNARLCFNSDADGAFEFVVIPAGGGFMLLLCRVGIWMRKRTSPLRQMMRGYEDVG